MDIAHPILLGDPDEILPMMEERNIDSSGIKIISPEKWEKTKTYVDEFHKLRQRKGITHEEARRLLTRHRHRNYFAAMMVRMGDADAMISGLTAHYPETIRPALEVLDLQPGVKRASGMYILIIKGKVYFLADTTLNFDPNC
jgi:allosteric NADP-dependent malic enzyme (EC 1.1.1.40)